MTLTVHDLALTFRGQFAKEVKPDVAARSSRSLLLRHSWYPWSGGASPISVGALLLASNHLCRRLAGPQCGTCVLHPDDFFIIIRYVRSSPLFKPSPVLSGDYPFAYPIPRYREGITIAITPR